MTVIQYIETCGWSIASEQKESGYMSVDINFLNPEEKEDQTEFDIHSFNIEELSDLFAAFCRENKMRADTATCVTVVQLADSIDDLD